MSQNTSKSVVVKGKSNLATTLDKEPITPEQEDRFNALETQIADNFLTAFKLAAALAEIREGKLYRVAGYKTFEKYCKERWDYSRSYCERLADVNSVLIDLKEYEDYETFPRNELQARVFVPLKKGQRIQLIESAHRDTEAKMTTASLFVKHRNQLFVDQFTPKPKAKSKGSVIEVESSVVPSPTIADIGKIVDAAEAVLKSLGYRKQSKDKQLADDLRNFINIAKPSVVSEKENSK